MTNNFFEFFKRHKLLCLLVLIIFMSFLVFLFNKNPAAPYVGFEEFNQIPGNVSTSVVNVSGNDVYFSNGRNIVRYNKTSGSSEAISNTKEIPKVSAIEVAPDKKHIAFKTTNAALELEPFKTLLKNMDLTTSDQWWMVDNSTQQLSFIKFGSEALKWVDSQKYVTGSGTEILEGSVSNNESRVLYSAKEPLNIFAYAHRGVYASEQNTQIIKVGQDGSSERLYDYGTSLLVNLRLSSCFFHQSSVDQSDETTSVLEGCTKKTIDIKGELTSEQFSEDGNNFFYYFKSEDGVLNKRYIDLKTGRSGEWAANLPIDTEDIEIIQVKNLSEAVLRANNNFYSQNAKKVKMIEDNSSYKLGATSVDFDKEDQTIMASKYGAFSDDEKATVIRSLSEKGYDPNLFVIKFFILDGEDDRWS